MSDSQKWLLLASALLVGVLLYLLAPVFTPFLVAALIAYLGDPLVDRLERVGLSRTLSVTVVFVLLFGTLTLVVLLLVPLIERQVSHFITRFPAYLDWLQHTALPWVQHTFGVDVGDLELTSLHDAVREHWQKAGGVAAQIIKTVSTSGAAMMAWVANLLLIPVVSFYLMRDWDALMERIRQLLPRSIEPNAVQIARESDDTLSAFLRGQLLVMLALGAIYSVGLWLVGLDLALLIGMLAGLVSFVPYLGFIIGILAAGVAILVQTHEWLDVLWVLLVFGVAQVIESAVLTPLLVGDRIGLHPVAVIFAVLAGGQLFGFVGVLLALPAAAVIAVLLRHAHQRYLRSNLYERAPGE